MPDPERVKMIQVERLSTSVEDIQNKSAFNSSGGRIVRFQGKDYDFELKEIPEIMSGASNQQTCPYSLDKSYGKDYNTRLFVFSSSGGKVMQIIRILFRESTNLSIYSRAYVKNFML